jgi:elongation factor P
MIDTGDLRKGLTLDLDGRLVKVVDFSHNKQGRGSAQVRMTLRDLRTGSLTQQTVQAGAKFSPVRLERQHVQFLYAEGDQRHFMDTETFDQVVLNDSMIGDATRFMRENDVVDLLTYNGEPIDIELPPAVTLAVADTDPGLKGDTASGATKPATLETGLVVNVPLFVNIGDMVKVDTRTGEYIERVS